MRVRSWMAVVVSVAGTTAVACVFAGAQKAKPNTGPAPVRSAAESRTRDDPQSKETKAEGTFVQTVQLNLVIAGLGRDGCDAEVKPGNQGCRFRPVTKHVTSQGKASIELRDVELRGADRTCTFAITLREPGQAPRTISRGFRLSLRKSTPQRSTSPESFTCFMSSPSKLATLEREDRVRR